MHLPILSPFLFSLLLLSVAVLSGEQTTTVISAEPAEPVEPSAGIGTRALATLDADAISFLPSDVEPLAIAPGAAFAQFKFRVALSGNAVNESGSFTTSVYLSADKTITSGDTLLNTYGLTGTWNVGTYSITTTPNPTIPANTAAGIYYLGLIVDAGDSNASNDTSSPDEVLEIRVGTEPVLAVSPTAVTFDALGHQQTFSAETTASVQVGPDRRLRHNVPLRLKTGTIDPAQTGTSTDDLNAVAARLDGGDPRRFWMVRFTGNVAASRRAELAQQGVTLHYALQGGYY